MVDLQKVVSLASLSSAFVSICALSSIAHPHFCSKGCRYIMEIFGIVRIEVCCDGILETFTVFNTLIVLFAIAFRTIDFDSLSKTWIQFFKDKVTHVMNE